MISICQDVYTAIENVFTSTPPECGGVLGAVSGEAISAFYFDQTGRSTPDSYTPDYEKINEILEKDWMPQGIRMVGMIHSHEESGNFPSCGDLYYCEQIMKNAEIDTFLLPIVTMNPFTIHWYTVFYDGIHLKVAKTQVESI